jgi:processive 1,2-diacylglycerol beta-glucosyltransferase
MPMPTALVMGGGWGLVKDEAFLSHLIRWREQIQIIICLGSNEKAMAVLTEDERFQHPNIRLLSFTKEIDMWMDVSDVLITKPGGMTCTEGLAKGIPMLFYKPIPGQEEENVQYFTQHGFGEQIKSAETVDHWIQLLLRNYPDVLKRRKAVTRKIKQYNPADCSQAIMQILQQYDADPVLLC